jgi:hypothetical protein
MWKINKNLEIKVAVAEIENLSIPDNEIAFNGLKSQQKNIIVNTAIHQSVLFREFWK